MAIVLSKVTGHDRSAGPSKPWDGNVDEADGAQVTARERVTWDA
jgi:hypothetical protein